MNKLLHRILLHRKSPLFLPVAGWVAYLLASILAAVVMMGYPRSTGLFWSVVNLLGNIFCPLFLLFGAACLISSTVYNTWSLIRNTSGRRSTILAAILSWSGFVLSVTALMLTLYAMYG